MTDETNGPLDLNAYYNKVYTYRAMSLIDFITENHLARSDIPEADRSRMRAILEANTLTACWLIACEPLGKVEEAARIREFRAEKSTRTNWKKNV